MGVVGKIIVDAVVDGAVKTIEKEGRKPGEKLTGRALVPRNTG